MNSWSLHRKRFVLSIMLVVVAILVGLPIYFSFHKAPSCSDHKQDGDETGVDCGGSCQFLCTSDTLPLITNGDPRVLQVASSTYEVVVSVQNPNVSAEVLRAPFTFNIYDATDDAPIKIIQGSTFVPRNSTFGLFEGPFTLDRAPIRATLTWGDNLAWQNDNDPMPDIAITNSTLSNVQSIPRLDATIVNNSLQPVSNIELVALISDANGNTIAASKTFVDTLDAGASTPTVFIWPTPFAADASTTFQILPRILPDKSYLEN